MSTLAKQQDWHLSQCDEAREHSYGVGIDTSDNPGWTLTVDLENTSSSGQPFPGCSYGVGEEAKPSGTEWLSCEVKDHRFTAAGDPAKLEEVINAFLAANSAV